MSSSTGTGAFVSYNAIQKHRPLGTRGSDIVRCLLAGALDIKSGAKRTGEAAVWRHREEERREGIRKSREAHASLISRFKSGAGAREERAQRFRRYLRRRGVLSCFYAR